MHGAITATGQLGRCPVDRPASASAWGELSCRPPGLLVGTLAVFEMTWSCSATRGTEIGPILSGVAVLGARFDRASETTRV